MSAVNLTYGVLVIKVALGIVLGFVVIQVGEYLLAMAFIRGVATLPSPTFTTPPGITTAAPTVPQRNPVTPPPLVTLPTPGFSSSPAATATANRPQGSGAGVATPAATTPVPTASSATSVPTVGYTHFNVIVYDGSTGQALAGVCVVVGGTTCGATSPLTDANGRWSADIQSSSDSTLWDVYFIKANYVTQFQQLTFRAGATRTSVVYLRPSR